MKPESGLPEELFCGQCGWRVERGVLSCPRCGSDDLLPARRVRRFDDQDQPVAVKSDARIRWHLDRDQWVALKSVILMVGWVLVAAFLATAQGRKALGLSVVILLALPVVFLAMLGYGNTHPNWETASPAKMWWSVLVGPAAPIFAVFGSIFALLAVGLGVAVALLAILAASLITFLFVVCSIAV